MSKITFEIFSGSPPPNREVAEITSALSQLGHGANELVEHVGIYHKEGPDGCKYLELKVVLNQPCPYSGRSEFKEELGLQWPDGLITKTIIRIVNLSIREKIEDLERHKSALMGFLLVPL